MPIYDIYQSEDQEIGASLVVHDDGRKEWDWSLNEWQGQVWYDDLKTAVEWAVDHNPQMDPGPISSSGFAGASQFKVLPKGTCAHLTDSKQTFVAVYQIDMFPPHAGDETGGKHDEGYQRCSLASTI